MSYRLPDFNNSANQWKAPGSNGCPVGNPDAIIACNLALGKRQNIGEYEELTMWLLMPKNTDIAGNQQVAGDGYGDIIEAPANTGKVYRVLSVDDAGAGFPNEHRIAVIQQSCTWPRPIPGGSPIPPAPPGIITCYEGTLPYIGTGGYGDWDLLFNVPQYGLLVVIFAEYQDTISGSSPSAKWSQDGSFPPTKVMPLRVYESQFNIGSAYCVLSCFSALTGVGMTRVRLSFDPGNGKMLQAKAYVVTGGPQSIFTTNHAHGAGSSVSLAASVANVSVPAIYLASFVVVNPPSGPGWSSPFNRQDADLSSGYLALTCVMTQGTYVSGVISTPSASLGAMVPSNWGGVIIGAQ